MPPEFGFFDSASPALASSRRQHSAVPPEQKERASGDWVLTDSELEVTALQDRVAMLEAKLRDADKMRHMWEACMTSLVGSILLGPEMNDMWVTPCPLPA